jgi:hypothetical protein
MPPGQIERYVLCHAAAVPCVSSLEKVAPRYFASVGSHSIKPAAQSSSCALSSAYIIIIIIIIIIMVDHDPGTQAL